MITEGHGEGRGGGGEEGASGGSGGGLVRRSTAGSQAGRARRSRGWSSVALGWTAQYSTVYSTVQGVREQEHHE